MCLLKLASVVEQAPPPPPPPCATWEEMLKSVPSLCLPSLSGKSMPLDTFDTPIGRPIWTHQVRVPDPPQVRLPHRFQVATWGAPPPKMETWKENPSLGAMNGENWLLVTVEPVDVQDFRKITHHYRGMYKICVKILKKKREMSTYQPVEVQDLMKTIHHSSREVFGHSRSRS